MVKIGGREGWVGGGEERKGRGVRKRSGGCSGSEKLDVKSKGGEAGRKRDVFRIIHSERATGQMGREVGS